MQTKNLVNNSVSTIYKTIAIGLVAGSILSAHAVVNADDTPSISNNSTVEVTPPSDVPAVETPAPAVETPAPAVETPAPAVETPAPATPAPAVETPAPATPAPDVPTFEVPKDAPVVETPPSLDVPTVPSKPQGKDNAESLDGVPTDKPVTPDTSSTKDKPQGKDNAESLDGVPAEKPKTTVEANEQGKSQIGTTSTSTGQVVHDVTKEPVETNTGASIVSTQNGNLVLSNGSVVAPEEVGGTVNEDKTISVTDKDGKLKTLPNTGTAESILGTIGAMLLTAVGYFYKKKLF